jgi:hypothetical protein
MVWFALAGIAAEIIGFILIIKSTKKLDPEEGSFMSERYVDSKSTSRHRTQRAIQIRCYIVRGIYGVIAGLAL